MSKSLGQLVRMQERRWAEHKISKPCTKCASQKPKKKMRGAKKQVRLKANHREPNLNVRRRGAWHLGRGVLPNSTQKKNLLPTPVSGERQGVQPDGPARLRGAASIPPDPHGSASRHAGPEMPHVAHGKPGARRRGKRTNYTPSKK